MSFYLPFWKIKLFLSQHVINRKNSFRSKWIIFNVLTMILYFVLFISIYTMQLNIFTLIGRKKIIVKMDILREQILHSFHIVWLHIKLLFRHEFPIETFSSIKSRWYGNNNACRSNKNLSLFHFYFLDNIRWTTNWVNQNK